MSSYLTGALDLDDEPFGFEKNLKYKQSRKRMKWGMERTPLSSGVRTRSVPKRGTDTFAKLTKNAPAENLRYSLKR